jgi:hypothetical protein
MSTSTLSRMHSSWTMSSALHLFSPTVENPNINSILVARSLSRTKRLQRQRRHRMPNRKCSHLQLHGHSC